MKGHAPRWWQELVRAEQGQAIIWVAVMLPLFLSIIGLAIDGGVVFDARRELQNVADGAARAGAMQVDQQVYRSSSGATVVLDVTSARAASAAYVASQGHDLSPSITAQPGRVVVSVSRSVPTSFLRIVGFGTVRISATATAQIEHGITEGSSS